jgi:hypothetical protein
MIGDSDSDVVAGRRAGAETVWLSDGHGVPTYGADPSHIAQTLSQAVDWVLDR